MLRYSQKNGQLVGEVNFSGPEGTIIDAGEPHEGEKGSSATA
jgi:hypothetical protein